MEVVVVSNEIRKQALVKAHNKSYHDKQKLSSNWIETKQKYAADARNRLNNMSDEQKLEYKLKKQEYNKANYKKNVEVISDVLAEKYSKNILFKQSILKYKRRIYLQKSEDAFNSKIENLRILLTETDHDDPKYSIILSQISSLNFSRHKLIENSEVPLDVLVDSFSRLEHLRNIKVKKGRRVLTPNQLKKHITQQREAKAWKRKNKKLMKTQVKLSESSLVTKQASGVMMSPPFFMFEEPTVMKDFLFEKMRFSKDYVDKLNIINLTLAYTSNMRCFQEFKDQGFSEADSVFQVHASRFLEFGKSFEGEGFYAIEEILRLRIREHTFSTKRIVKGLAQTSTNLSNLQTIVDVQNLEKGEEGFIYSRQSVGQIAMDVVNAAKKDYFTIGNPDLTMTDNIMVADHRKVWDKYLESLIICDMGVDEVDFIENIMPIKKILIKCCVDGSRLFNGQNGAVTAATTIIDPVIFSKLVDDYATKSLEFGKFYGAQSVKAMKITGFGRVEDNSHYNNLIAGAMIKDLQKYIYFYYNY